MGKVVLRFQVEMFALRPTLMGAKNLNKNGPSPFVFLGTKNMVRANLMVKVLFWHGFDNKSKACPCGGDTKMKLSNGNDHLLFKTRG